jgi:hypothetical protein
MGYFSRNIPFFSLVQPPKREEERERENNFFKLSPAISPLPVARIPSSKKGELIYATRATRGYQKQGISPKVQR